MDITPQQIRHILVTMKPRTVMYETIKKTLQEMDRWKNLPRGKKIDNTKTVVIHREEAVDWGA